MGFPRGVLRGFGSGVGETYRIPIPPYMVNGELITAAGASARRVPPKVFELDIELWGPGGGGAGSHGSNGPGGGGGGAYCKRDNKAVTAEDEITFDIGAGGAGGAYSLFGGQVGGTGSDSTCDSMTAGAGVGGNPGSFPSPGTGGAAGTASGGDTNTSGTAGQAGGNTGSATGGAAATPNGDPGTAPGGGGGGSGGSDGAANGNAGRGGTAGGAGGGAHGLGSTAVASGQAGSLGGNGANGGVKFTWVEEMLEDFEEFSGVNPVNGPQGLSWLPAGGSSNSQSASHVKHGSASIRCQATSTNFAGVANPVSTDLTGYTHLKVTVNVVTIPATGYFMLYAFSDAIGGTDAVTHLTTVGATGEFVLTVSLAGIDDITQAFIALTTNNVSGVKDVYIDKLVGVPA